MHNLILISVPFLPVLLAISTLFLRFRFIIVLAPLVALLAGLTMPSDINIHLPWIMQGIHLQLDKTGHLFLLFSSLIWFISSLYLVFCRQGPEATGLYRGFFLLAFSGNMLLILAADMLSFYLGFAMMGLSAYGLMIKPSQQARRAARVYLAFTLVGELALFCAILLLFSSTGTLLFSGLAGQPLPGLAIALILLGFGIKLALPGLHLWLPLAYTASPLITAALLSGPMMKAGLLGWIRFLPGGTESLIIWGEPLIWAGTAGLLLGSMLALMQQQPRAVLAYSSIAKMGLMSCIFGFALKNPAQADLIIGALVLFSMHHLLLKSSLFLGLAEYRQSTFNPYIYSGLVVLAMGLVGLPWSGGSAAKHELLMSSYQELGLLLKVSGFLSALMMFRFLWLLRPRTLESFMVNTAFNNASPVPLLAWFMLIPVAWWGPFAPGSIQFELSSLLMPAVAALAFMLFIRVFSLPSRIPVFCRPGDVYHLLKQFRLTSPVHYRAQMQPSFEMSWPTIKRRNNKNTQDQLSIAIPGLLWLGVVLMMIFFLLFPQP